MIQIKINEIEYNLRSNWNEVTFNEYVEIVKVQGKTLIERLSVYTGITKEILDKFTLSQINTISPLVEFMDNPDLVMAFSDTYTSGLSVGEQPYWKVEKAKQLLNTEVPMSVAAEIVELYTGNDDGENGLKISDKPVTSVIGIAAFFCAIIRVL